MVPVFKLKLIKIKRNVQFSAVVTHFSCLMACMVSSYVVDSVALWCRGQEGFLKESRSTWQKVGVGRGRVYQPVGMYVQRPWAQDSLTDTYCLRPGWTGLQEDAEEDREGNGETGNEATLRYYFYPKIPESPWRILSWTIRSDLYF